MHHGFPPEIYPHYTVFSMRANSGLLKSSKGTGLIEETTKDKRRFDDQRLSKVLSADPHSDCKNFFFLLINISFFTQSVLQS
jgi:hypothetical protein